jgi:hypothetical protein
MKVRDLLSIVNRREEMVMSLAHEKTGDIQPGSFVTSYNHRADEADYGRIVNVNRQEKTVTILWLSSGKESVHNIVPHMKGDGSRTWSLALVPKESFERHVAQRERELSDVIANCERDLAEAKSARDAYKRQVAAFLDK